MRSTWRLFTRSILKHSMMSLSWASALLMTADGLRTQDACVDAASTHRPVDRSGLRRMRFV